MAGCFDEPRCVRSLEGLVIKPLVGIAGAVLLLSFRTIRSGHKSRPTVASHLPAPMAT